MLDPGQRSHLHALLRPPPGYRFDAAVGTTYSLDLLSALTVPLSFAMLDWEKPDGSPAASPLAVLEALRRCRDRFTIFAQAGQTQLPREYPQLLALLETVVVPVRAPDPKGVFHPKVWVLRFVNDKQQVAYRMLCLSRNLTFDRCWDTVVSLDGTLGSRRSDIEANLPLADFIRRLPGLAITKAAIDARRRRSLALMADELARVEFKLPEGFTDYAFHAGGLDGGKCEPFGSFRDKCLVVAPFLHPEVISGFVSGCGKVHLVSRPESLEALPAELQSRCASLHILKPEALAEEDEEKSTGTGNEEPLDGLHAKLFVVDRGWHASVFSGSFNATRHAFRHNVEFMVELVGKRSHCGVERFLSSVSGETRFADLLEAVEPASECEPQDTARQDLDELLRDCKSMLVDGLRGIRVRKKGALFDMVLDWAEPDGWPIDEAQVKVWPVTLPPKHGSEPCAGLRFGQLSFETLTAFFACEIRVKVGPLTEKVVFVLNLPTDGMPADREDRLVRSLVQNKEQLLRYLYFLLAAQDAEGASSAALQRLMAGNATSSQSMLPVDLFEQLVRALYQNPEQLKRIGKLLESIERTQDGKQDPILDSGLLEIWAPIRAVAGKQKKR